MVNKHSEHFRRYIRFPNNVALRYLQRDPLKHILHLKMLKYYGETVKTIYVTDGSIEGVLLLFPTTALSYDHKEYGEYEFVAMPVADSPQMLGQLLRNIPSSGVIFKLIQASDEAQIDLLFDGKRVRRFLNYTAVGSVEFEPVPNVVISTKLNDKLVEAFGQNSHSSTELTRFFADGGKAFSIKEDGISISVGMVYRNYEHIWEVAALYTIPSARHKGYSTRIVRAALYNLQQFGYTPRYVVDEANTYSINLAQVVGLEHYLSVIHYTT